MKACLLAILLVTGTATAVTAQDAVPVATLLEQATTAEQAGDAEQAESLLRQAYDVASDRADVVLRLGRVVYANGNGAEGLGLLYRALQLDPKSGDAVLALVDALLAEAAFYEESGDTGNHDAMLQRALDALEKLRATGAAEGPELELRRIQVLAKTLGREKEAFELAWTLLKSDPADQRFHVSYVAAATAAKTFDDALLAYDTLEAEDWLKLWFKAEVQVARGHWRFNRYTDDDQAVKDYAAAELLYQDAARLEESVFPAASERISFCRSWSGWTRYRQDRNDEAWELFNSAFGRNPANGNAVEGLSYVGSRYYERGDLEHARELFRQACTIAPDRADFWNNYGLMCRDTGQYEESYRAYLRARALSPDDPRTINDCALILQYHLHRDLDHAEREYIRAEDLSRAKLRQAEEQAGGEGDDGAVVDQKMVLGDILVNLARLFTDQGRMQEAAEHWNELRAVDPGRNELPENRNSGR